MELLVKCTLSGLTPLYGSDFEEKKKLKIGETYKVKVSRPRNPEFHRKFFALINIAYENQEVTTVFNYFYRWMIVQAGYYDVVTYPDGEITKEPKSISFAKMSQSEFEKIYKDMVQVVITVTGADEQMINEELAGFL